MKIENKKVKQNDLINQTYLLIFCFIKYLLYVNFMLYKSNKAIFKLLHIYTIF
jgi:hypothetical protein